jgi:hypothetical protein
MDVAINNWAVFAAALSSMIVGSLWYMPAVLGRPWVALTGRHMDQRPGGYEMGIMYGSTFVASLITAYVIAYAAFLFNYFSHSVFLFDALAIAFWLWLGLTATRIYVHDTFEGRPGKLTLLTVGHELLTVLIMAFIIGVMGK